MALLSSGNYPETIVSYRSLGLSGIDCFFPGQFFNPLQCNHLRVVGLDVFGRLQ